MPSTSKLWKIAGPLPSSEPNWHVLFFLHSILICSHIVCSSKACKHHLPENKFQECPESISTYTQLFLPNIHYSVPEHNFKSVQKAFTPAQIPSKHITVPSRGTTHLQVSKTQGRLIILNITHNQNKQRCIPPP
jgi:hypothetical protein